jgi:RNase P subunit RPR2
VFNVAIDGSSIAVGSLAIIIVMLLVYIAYRFRESKMTMTTVDVDSLIYRTDEVERLLLAIKRQKCWNCGSEEKDVEGNIYEDNIVKFKCKQCGTQTTWTKGKEQWKMTTKTKTNMETLQEKVTEATKNDR